MATEKYLYDCANYTAVFTDKLCWDNHLWDVLFSYKQGIAMGTN